MNNFKELGLADSSIAIIEKKGFEEPTEIQAKTIPVLLNSTNDIIAQAQTGTGKTAAFGLIFIEKLIEGLKQPQAIVLTPTRELAIQVAEEINSLKGNKDLTILPIYGGQSINLQHKQLRKGIDVVIGTPGRIQDHLRQKTLKLNNIKYAVLDEADEMLNMGFIEDIENILKHVNKERQLLLFSATMPKRIKELAKNFMNDMILIQAKKTELTTELIDQIYFEVKQSNKFEALCRIIDIETEFYGIIFCRTKVDVDMITKQLIDRGYSADALHGDIMQRQREKILGNFKQQKTMILVATDVAARGIDVNNLTHVINFSIPHDPEAYIHRIGRTGRAGNEGTAITFVTPAEYKRLSFIKRVAKTEIRKEKLPNIDEIISIKKNRILADIEELIENEDLNYYKEIAESIFNDISPENIIAALLKQSFSQELDINNYTEIKEGKSRNHDLVDNSGKTRLFITTGKKDNMTPKKLVTYIEKEAGVNQRAIKNVEIFDAFSFITVPFEEAELILEKFKEKKKGKKFTIEKASPRKKKKRKR